MNMLLTVGLSNVAVASLLALIAWSAGRWLRRPALTHGLWLLVFLKLLTPPIYPIAVIRTAASVPIAQGEAIQLPPPALPEAQPEAEWFPGVAARHEPRPLPVIPEQNVANDPAPGPVAPPQDAPPAEAPMPAAPIALAVAPPVDANVVEHAIDWSWLPRALIWTWLTGVALWLALATVRLVRFQRLLRWGQSAPPELRQLAHGVAARMEVRCPRLLLVPGMVSPMLWAFGRKPRLVLPAALLERLTPEQWQTLLAHELAHWRRRDHWVRWLELAALALYWWCPLVWWAKEQLQQAEEECCDAWVVAVLPGAARDYALALVETVDFLSGARAVLPPAASGLGHVHFLRRRLTMILRGRTPRALTLTGLIAVLALGLVLLPLAPGWAQDPPPAAPVQKDGKGDKDKDEKVDPDKARQDIQKLQDDFIKLQRQMEDRRRELEEKIQKEFGDKQRDLMKRMQEAMQKAGFPGGSGAFPGVPPGAFRAPVPFAVPPAFNRDNFPAGPPPGGGVPDAVPPRPDLERRLDELERKIDRLMERLGGGKAPPERQPANPNIPPRGGAGAPPALNPGATPPAAPPAGKNS